MHDLLDISNSHIHSLLEDLVFHTAPIMIGWNESSGLERVFGPVLRYHDMIHGNAKRHLIHVKVVDRPLKEPPDENGMPALPLGDGRWVEWAERSGVSVAVEGGGTLYPPFWPRFERSLCW